MATTGNKPGDQRRIHHTKTRARGGIVTMAATVAVKVAVMLAVKVAVMLEVKAAVMVLIFVVRNLYD